MNYSKLFLTCCLTFLLGIALASVWLPSLFFSFILFLVASFFFLLIPRNKYFLVLGCWGIFLVLGIMRFQLAWPADSTKYIQNYADQDLTVIGVVSKEPDIREDNVKLEIKTEKILISPQEIQVNGKLLITTFLYPQYNYGDRLEFTCRLQKPAPINNFNYDKYLARYNVYAVCYYPSIKLVAENQGNFFLSAIYNFKSYFVSRLNRILPEPQSSFLAGLLMGAKKAIPTDLTETFSLTGTSHLVAVSGYNVTILASFLLLVALNFGLGRKKAFWLIIILLLIFTILTGLQASIIRAAIMGSLVLLASYLGRLNKMTNALAFTAAVMLLINPKILRWDLGFQLSFLATLGLIYLQPILASWSRVKYLRSKLAQLIIGDYLLTTLAAIIMTTPLILYNFGKLALIAPLANILVLPLIPLAMLFGFIAAGLGLFSLTLGWVAGWFVWLILSYVIWILQLLAGLKWAYYEVDKISFWLMIGSYGLIGLILVVNKYKSKIFAIIKAGK